MTVLIVEDDPGMRQVWAECVKGFAREIRCADNLPAALSMMRKNPPPDLVLLDLRLPGSSAENTLAHIDELKHVNALALVVVVTGLRDANIAALAKMSGADGFAEKGEIDTQKALLELMLHSLQNKQLGDGPGYERSMLLLERLNDLVTK